jgi:tetratricopeptide (TPR) repeat protein
MSDEDLEARLDARIVRTLKEMADEPFKDLMAALVGKMGLRVTGGAVLDQVAFLEGEREGSKYLVMASRKPEHATPEGIRKAKERAEAERRAPVLIVADDMGPEEFSLADQGEVSLADRQKLVLLIKRFDLSHALTKDADRAILESRGSPALPSVLPFDALLKSADDDLKASRPREAIKSLRAAVASKPEHDLAWRMLADAYFRLGEYEEALEALGQALRTRFGDPTSWYMVALTLHKLGRLKEEVKAYDQALLSSKRMHPALLNKGATLYSLGRKEEALQAFDEMLRLYPKDPQATNNRGLVLRSLGRHEEALRAFQSVASSDPSNLDALVNIALTLADMGLAKEAVSAWKEAVAADRKRADLWLHLAQAEKAAGMVAEAAESFEVAETLDARLEEEIEGEKGAYAASHAQEPKPALEPQDEELALKHLNGALLLQATGKLEEALKEAELALSFERAPEGVLRKASILLELGRLEEAIACLGQGLREAPRDEDLALELDACVYRLGRREEGARILRPLLENAEARKRVALTELMLGRATESLKVLNRPEGEDPAHDRTKALALIWNGDHAEAAELLMRMVASFGTSPQTLNDLAVALRLEGMLEEAEDSVRQALEAEPKYADAWNNLGCIRFLRGDYQDAERSLQEAIQLDRRPELLLNLGICQLALDDLEGAESSFLSALRLQESAEPYNGLGMVAERRNERVRALEMFGEALKRAPEFKDAQENLARIVAALNSG